MSGVGPVLEFCSRRTQSSALFPVSKTLHINQDAILLYLFWDEFPEIGEEEESSPPALACTPRQFLQL